MTRDLAPSHDCEVMNSFRHKFIDSMCKSENVQNEALNAHVWALHQDCNKLINISLDNRIKVYNGVR